MPAHLTACKGGRRLRPRGNRRQVERAGIEPTLPLMLESAQHDWPNLSAPDIAISAYRLEVAAGQLDVRLGAEGEGHLTAWCRGTGANLLEQPQARDRGHPRWLTRGWPA
jgi:hypothetical protein